MRTLNLLESLMSRGLRSQQAVRFATKSNARLFGVVPDSAQCALAVAGPQRIGKVDLAIPVAERFEFVFLAQRDSIEPGDVFLGAVEVSAAAYGISPLDGLLNEAGVSPPTGNDQSARTS